MFAQKTFEIVEFSNINLVFTFPGQQIVTDLITKSYTYTSKLFYFIFNTCGYNMFFDVQIKLVMDKWFRAFNQLHFT